MTVAIVGDFLSMLFVVVNAVQLLSFSGSRELQRILALGAEVSGGGRLLVNVDRPKDFCAAEAEEARKL